MTQCTAFSGGKRCERCEHPEVIPHTWEYTQRNCTYEQTCAEYTQHTKSNNRAHVAHCRGMAIDPWRVDEAYIQRMKRYSFLSSFTLRYDAEEAEVQELAKEFAWTGWELLPRESLT